MKNTSFDRKLKNIEVDVFATRSLQGLYSREVEDFCKLVYLNGLEGCNDALMSLNNVNFASKERQKWLRRYLIIWSPWTTG